MHKPTIEQWAAFLEIAGSIIAEVVQFDPTCIEMQPFVDFFVAIIHTAKNINPALFKESDFLIDVPSKGLVIRNTITTERLIAFSKQSGKFLSQYIQRYPSFVESEEFFSIAAAALSFGFIAVLQTPALKPFSQSIIFQKFIQVSAPIMLCIQEENVQEGE